MNVNNIVIYRENEESIPIPAIIYGINTLEEGTIFIKLLGTKDGPQTQVLAPIELLLPISRIPLPPIKYKTQDGIAIYGIEQLPDITKKVPPTIIFEPNDVVLFAINPGEFVRALVISKNDETRFLIKFLFEEDYPRKVAISTITHPSYINTAKVVDSAEGYTCGTGSLDDPFISKLPFDEYVRQRFMGNPEAFIDNRHSRNSVGSRGLSAIEAFIGYAHEINLLPQIEFMEALLNGQILTPNHTKALHEYVKSSDPFQRSSPEINPSIGFLDEIFAAIPPLTCGIVVFKKYSNGIRPTGVNMQIKPQNRFISTSLSYTFVCEAKFQEIDNPNVTLVRMELLPGMKIIPVLSWEKWTGGGGYSKTQFEILLPRYAQAYVLPEIFISHPESLISQPIPILMDTMPFNKNPDKEFIMNDKITQLHSGVLTLPRINYHFIISSSSMSGSCYLKLFFNTGNPLSIPLYWKQNGGSVNILDKNKESIILKITNDDDINNENLKLSLYEKI